MRFDILPKNFEHNEVDIIERIASQEGFKIDSLIKGQSYWINTSSETHVDKIQNLLRDPIDTTLLGKETNLNELSFDYLVQVSFKPGVTDNSAKSTEYILKKEFPNSGLQVASGELYLLKTKLNFEVVQKIGSHFFGNPLIQKVEVFKTTEIAGEIPSPKFPEVHIEKQLPKEIDLNINDDQLIKLSKDSLWALSLEELKLIQDHFNDPKTTQYRISQNLPKLPTDIELEILAQTWSEHCKHKIFSADIDYTEDSDTKIKIGNKKVQSIFKSHIKKATRDVEEKFNLDWLISVFTDNAGIVRYDDNVDYCLKVETHNSPSALDPYGGALTGILGVNRDILGCGIGAKPIANTDVLCFAPVNYSKEILGKLPPKLKHPKSILRGVHRGIEDGGNKSGIPTVNGAIVFNDNYAGKPLVYCGTAGVLPQKINNIPTHEKRQKPGDYIVVCGGSVGADGIHGATFSSLELDDNAPSTAVQIGDPFTQKKLGDFLFEARDLGLYNSVTDNGAGGLSSSVGEMGERTNGAFIDISKVPLKYSGLSPYEIVISESQERMTFSVPKETLDEFLKLAEKRECNPAVIGEFNDSGYFSILNEGVMLASISMKFLHDTLPPMQLTAHYEGSKKFSPWHGVNENIGLRNLSSSIQDLLKDPNIQSKRGLVSEFDAEVKGATTTKPFIQKDKFGPSDAAVIWGEIHGGTKNSAICLSSGIAPQYSHIDTYLMTQYAIDEAVRNAVASGANPNFISLCDNYCWPDPIKSANNPDGNHKLAQLVRSTQAIYDMAMIYGTPFISGKDSMKNDFIGKDSTGKTIKISVPPTLLVTSICKVDHIEDRVTTDFKNAGDLVYFLGDIQFEKEFFSTNLKNSMEAIPVTPKENYERYLNIHQGIKKNIFESIHDISDGGSITAIIESCFPKGFGFSLKNDCLSDKEVLPAMLFNEPAGSFIISVKKENQNLFESQFKNTEYRLLGEVSSHSKITLGATELETNHLYDIWSKNDY